MRTLGLVFAILTVCCLIAFAVQTPEKYCAYNSVDKAYNPNWTPQRDLFPHSSREGGETCADALVISGLPYTDVGYTCDNVDDYEFECPYSSTSPDVVYVYTPAATQLIEISLCDSYYDTKLIVYQDDCMSVPYACNDDFCSGPNFTGGAYLSNAVIHVFAGHNYYIVVDGYGGECGNYILNVKEWIPAHSCPQNTLFGQPPYRDPNCYTSDLQFPYKVFDNFWGLTQPVCDLHWWGINLFWSGSWEVCTNEEPMTFLIEFWSDLNGQPGTVVCTYTVSPNRTQVDVSPDGDPLYEWSVTLDPCCQLEHGWISIQGISVASPNCAFLWATSPVEDASAWQIYPDGNLNQTDTDFAFCLTSGAPCNFHSSESDMGDLPRCNYPTLCSNPSHELTGVAWLGEGITAELCPHYINADAMDDGVFFIDPPWTPCEMEAVRVVVSAGPNFQRYLDCGGHLYLSAWKDGNTDGDFCDVLCNGNAPEWIIQDALVLPGIHFFAFPDPGDRYVPYPGIFRFRLMSAPHGALGFGLITTECPEMQCGTFDHDSIGEVEDYIIDYLQPVELTAFNATVGDNSVTLNWSTATETSNARFEIERNGMIVYNTNGAGTSSQPHSYSWTDDRVFNGTTYEYSLVGVNETGGREYLSTVNATPKLNAGSISEYALRQNYPNPFNPITTIVYDMKETGFVSLKVYNLLGQEVAVLVYGEVAQGRHVVILDATNLTSGVYVCKMETNGFIAQNKMLLIK